MLTPNGHHHTSLHLGGNSISYNDMVKYIHDHLDHEIVKHEIHRVVPERAASNGVPRMGAFTRTVHAACRTVAQS